MVIYTREKKTLIIPEGLQGGSADCKDAIAAAYSSGITVGYGQGYEAGQAECSGGTDCSSAITEAYQSGITEGINTQKSRMESITITANTAVTRTDGWNQITVNVPSESGDCSEAISEAYQSGYTAGIDNQRERLVATAITANGLYERTDGFCCIDVQVPTTTPCNIQDTKSINLDDYAPSFQTTVTPDAGYAGLQAVSVNGSDIYSRAVGDVSSQFVTLSATTNGLYTPSSTFAVFKEVYVDVPSSGDCSQAIEEAYQSGHTGGVNEQKAKLDGITITANTTVTREDGWSSVTVNVASGTDCSQAIEEAYQSGITSQIGEIDTIYVSFIVEDPYNIDEIGIRPFECDGHSFVPTNAIEAVDLPPINRVWYAVKGGFNYKFMTPEVLKVKVYDSVIQRWGNWSVERVGFNGNFIEGSLSAHTAGRYEGGFTYAPISASTEYADETHSWIVIDLGGNTSSCTTAISDALQSGYTVGYSGGYSSGYTDGEAHSLYTEITFTNEQDITFGSGAYAFWIGTDYQNVTELDGDLMVSWDNKTLSAGTHTVKTNCSFITNNTELVFQGNYVGYNDGGSFTQTAVTNVVMKLKKTITQ